MSAAALGLGAGCGTGVLLGAEQSCARCDDDFSEPFGGSVTRTAGAAAAAAAVAALTLAQLVDRAPKKGASAAFAPADPPPPELTHAQLKEGFTGYGRYKHLRKPEKAAAANSQDEVRWIYTGEWRDGQRHGEGKLSKPGMELQGTFQDGKVHGHGILELTGSGDRYEGEFTRGQIGPTGTYVSAEGWSYSGEWSDNEMHGKGQRLNVGRGTAYVGEFANGGRDGKGSFSWPGGSLTCKWHQGLPCGEAVLCISESLMPESLGKCSIADPAPEADDDEAPSTITISGTLLYDPEAEDGRTGPMWHGEVVFSAEGGDLETDGDGEEGWAPGETAVECFHRGMWADGLGDANVVGAIVMGLAEALRQLAERSD